ncbi:mechanosensitive ion channel family protein [Sessilibacter sp. MAH4]
MKEIINDLSQMPPWLIISIGVICAFIVLMIIKQILLARISSLIDKTKFELDTIFINAAKKPATLLVIALTIFIFEGLLNFYQIDITRLERITVFSERLLIILALVIFCERLCSGFIAHYAKQSAVLNNSKSLASGIARVIILSLGILIVLSSAGVSITPIIASLGITSLAVALALQPTLENFFSGLQIIADKPIRVGDFIELESKEQGYVEKIGWRSTWVRMLPNNMIVIPNSKIAGSKIINYYYPEKELSVPVEVGVHYSSDLEKVEQITLEVAREILQTHEFGVKTYETFIVYHTFDSSSINFTVMLRAKEYANRFFIRSAFIKALHKRYALEGIVIPYPIRAINTDQESAILELKKNQSA